MREGESCGVNNRSGHKKTNKINLYQHLFITKRRKILKAIEKCIETGLMD